jgi:hypothetical protein
LIPAGTGLAYHKERKAKKARDKALLAKDSTSVDTEGVEEALKQALNTEQGDTA